MAKLNKLTISLVLFVLLLANIALAVEVVDNKVEIDVLYSHFDDENQETTIAVNGQFSITSVEGEENLQAVFVGLPTGYSANTITNIDVPAGATPIVVSFTINVPHTRDSGISNVGTIEIRSSTGTLLDSVPLTQNTASMLELNDLDVDYVSDDNNREDDSFDGESTDAIFKLQENVKPGTEVTFTFDIENLFDRDYDDGTLEDVTITIEADDNDLFEDDFEEEYDLGDIDQEENEELVVSFTINEDVDADDYTFDITLEADDSNNVNHKVEKQLEIKVRRERDDVRISRMEILPSTIPIDQISSGFTLDLELKNYGTRDQKNAAVSVFNQELGIDRKINDLTLDRFSDDDNTWSQILEFDLPKNVKQKTYSLEVRTFIDRDKLINIQRIDMVVGPEAEEETQIPAEDDEETTDNNETDVPETETPDTTDNTEDSNQITSSPIVSTVEESYATGDILIAALFVTVGLTIVAIIALFVILVKK